ncbi:hypothetical protein B0H19DRAFT_1118411 [Mycena capillaripes]|nr:hypothetical protein B0H19DRAFT_1118411 [Mycena capillaripes]
MFRDMTFPRLPSLVLYRFCLSWHLQPTACETFSLYIPDKNKAPCLPTAPRLMYLPADNAPALSHFAWSRK